MRRSRPTRRCAPSSPVGWCRGWSRPSASARTPPPELLIVAGDNIDRVRSEAAWARLCGVAPVPASSGLTTRHRLNRGGHRQANAALYRAVIVRMQHHEPTRTYVARRTLEGKSKAEIIRCLKRLLARETWALLRPLRSIPRPASAAA